MRIELDCDSLINAHTRVKVQLRLLCDRDTRGTISSAFHDTGPWIFVHYHDCAAQRRYSHETQMGSFSTRGHEHAQVTTCKGMQPLSRGMQRKGLRPNAKSLKDATAISLHTRTTSGSDHPSLHHAATSSLESQQMEMLHVGVDVPATVCRPTETDTDRKNEEIKAQHMLKLGITMWPSLACSMTCLSCLPLKS